MNQQPALVAQERREIRASRFRVYYKDAVGAFLVFDVTRADSFSAVEKWKIDLDSKAFLFLFQPVPIRVA